MPAYKDEQRKTWYAKFGYKDWQGEYKTVTKRGFATKRDAIAWEESFKREKAGSADMTVAEFVERYRKDHYPRIKYSTTVTKDTIITSRILPYFGNKKLADVSVNDVVQWQNEMIKYRDPVTGKPFTKSYLKTLHNQLSAMLNYAVKYFNLKENVAAKVGNMGTDKGIEMNFWTKEEYLKFAEVMMEKPLAYYCFETLYWTGMREGEMLALTPADIDFKKNTISITKTYHYLNGQDLITSPKTNKSVRVVSIPEFLAEELKEYMELMYNLNPTDRLFPVRKSFLAKSIHAGASKAGLKQIRVHDLRHSHVSLLINMGYNVVAIGNRVGHESAEITFRYAHMFPSVQADMAEKLNSMKED